MPVTKKTSTKKKATKKVTKATKRSPAKKTVKKKAAPKKKTATKKTAAKTSARKKKVPAKSKIEVRKVAPPALEAKETVKTKEEEAAELEEFLRDFSEEKAVQEQDEKEEHEAMLPATISETNSEADNNKNMGNDVSKKINEITQEVESHPAKEPVPETKSEIGYEENSGEETEEDDFAYDNGLGRSVGLYRKIAYFFIALVSVLLVFIFFFSVVKVTIVLIPDQERVHNNIIFDVYDEDREGVNDNAVQGVVRKINIKENKVYPATGQRVIGQEAVGGATIINNYTKNQPLVATTRLLTADNKLFRIKQTVNVPAGGSVQVEIYADDPSPEMAIGPAKFTIPGLWAGLQDKIYAESDSNIVYQEKIKKRITQEDIDNGVRDLRQELLTEAKAKIDETYSEYTQRTYNIDENSISTIIDGSIDEEKDDFEITMSADVVVVAFSEDQAINLAEQKFNSSIAENKEILSFDEDGIEYSLNNFDYNQGIATINATFEGKVSLRENSDIINKDKIVGLKREQLEVYLDSLPEIAGYEIKFYPSFITKVPKLTDRIEIEIKK